MKPVQMVLEAITVHAKKVTEEMEICAYVSL